MMREWDGLQNRIFECEEALRLARMDRDAVGNEIEELLILGGGVEPGRYVARIDSGKLTVGREEEETKAA
jgi:hypothetical protein